ncbi:hypothetical protein WHR41_03024 [Cladosporium halotolerans]|uniref:Uncharacterized protein n=1 Tax=Cladosporium halotolerans TaxID=1052096 RepID=A0AB34KTV0_9PEZI
MDDLSHLEYLPSTPELNSVYPNTPSRLDEQPATAIYLSSSSSDTDFDDNNNTQSLGYHKAQHHNNITLSPAIHHGLPMRPLSPGARPQPYLPYTTSKLPTTLSRRTMSPTPPKPAIKVLLVLTPNPASAHEHALFASLGAQFAKDFSPSSSKWTCVSLYAHFRAWADEHASAGTDTGTGTGTGVDIGSIHPLALRARLESETEVPWQLALPVLQELIDAEVAKGARKFVVVGLSGMKWDGAANFGETIADPNGILIFLPADASDKRVPFAYKDRTVKIKPTGPEDTYSALLAALYARAFPAREEEVEVIDLVGESDADTALDDEDAI